MPWSVDPATQCFGRHGKETTRDVDCKLKGLVLAGGKGSRLRPLTATGAKQLVPVANKPVLFYALEQLVEAGVTDIGIITGDTADQVIHAVGDGSAFGAAVTYIPQPAPLGLAHAIITAQSWLGDSPFCMFLGDNFLGGGIVSYTERFRERPCAAQILLRRVDGEVDSESTLIGPVVVEMGATIAASTVRGPAVIGPGTSVRDSYIGPFTAIGPDCELSGCEIEHSIVLERSIIRNV